MYMASVENDATGSQVVTEADDATVRTAVLADVFPVPSAEVPPEQAATESRPTAEIRAAAMRRFVNGNSL
ncbi:hypothetical protein [Nocardioides dokdonensis]|uniref:hypothetical protein n=1 Tax=Nocardioides dokdonensis TaxID=450734 RepID=UPI00082A230F|nr:hypothetical protein [Nocardioides dokdonensis]